MTRLMRKKSPNLNFSFSFANLVGRPDKFNKSMKMSCGYSLVRRINEAEQTDVMSLKSGLQEGIEMQNYKVVSETNGSLRARLREPSAFANQRQVDDHASA